MDNDEKIPVEEGIMYIAMELKEIRKVLGSIAEKLSVED